MNSISCGRDQREETWLIQSYYEIAFASEKLLCFCKSVGIATSLVKGAKVSNNHSFLFFLLPLYNIVASIRRRFRKNQRLFRMYSALCQSLIFESWCYKENCRFDMVQLTQLYIYKKLPFLHRNVKTCHFTKQQTNFE